MLELGDELVNGKITKIIDSYRDTQVLLDDIVGYDLVEIEVSEKPIFRKKEQIYLGETIDNDNFISIYSPIEKK
ncbi:MAG: hypothetical protein M0Q88_05885 [Bacilli bacterium]|nr:hypothetical protein [Bacilli bacterium]